MLPKMKAVTIDPVITIKKPKTVVMVSIGSISPPNKSKIA